MKEKIFEDEFINITIEDDDEMMLIKNGIKSLNPVQRKIFLTYVETGTYTATAKEFGVSIPTVCSYIKKIRNKLIEYVFNNF